MQWYEAVSRNETFTQGDIIFDFPLPLIAEKDEYPFFNTKGTLQDVIVMTQACDIEQGKTEEISFCALYSIEKIIQEFLLQRFGNYEKSELSPKQRKQPEKIVSEIKKGEFNNFHLLEECKLECSFGHKVVKLDKTYTMKINSVRHLLENKDYNRVRLLPPYREHLAQSYSRLFSRIGLPLDIDTTNLTNEEILDSFESYS